MPTPVPPANVSCHCAPSDGLSAGQGRGDGPVANSLSGSAHPVACCSLRTGSLSGILEAVCPKMCFQVLHLNPEQTYPFCSAAAPSRLWRTHLRHPPPSSPYFNHQGLPRLFSASLCCLGQCCVPHHSLHGSLLPLSFALSPLQSCGQRNLKSVSEPRGSSSRLQSQH